MTDRNLNAYYYGFESTGCDLVDAVLEQVARAGKAFHSTEDWNEEDTDGRSPAAKMQAAANASAQAILALIAENERLIGDLSACTEAPGGCGYWREAAKQRETERDQLRAEMEERRHG